MAKEKFKEFQATLRSSPYKDIDVHHFQYIPPQINAKSTLSGTLICPICSQELKMTLFEKLEGGLMPTGIYEVRFFHLRTIEDKDPASVFIEMSGDALRKAR